jgi:biopolymer transport protein ExbD
MVHKHHGADRVVKGEVPRASSAMNITPMIDVLLVLYGDIVQAIDPAKGAGVTRVGIVTERMRGAKG